MRDCDSFRYFLFHATLIVVLAILGDPQSPEVIAWQADVDVARNNFQTILGDNPLASRCVDIINHILPPDDSYDAGVIPHEHFFSDDMDFSMWPTDSDDVLGLLGWTDFGQGL